MLSFPPMADERVLNQGSLEAIVLSPFPHSAPSTTCVVRERLERIESAWPCNRPFESALASHRRADSNSRPFLKSAFVEQPGDALISGSAAAHSPVTSSVPSTNYTSDTGRGGVFQQIQKRPAASKSGEYWGLCKRLLGPERETPIPAADWPLQPDTLKQP